MQTRTKQGLKVLRRVHEFLDGTNVTPALGGVTKHVEALGGVVSRLSAHAVEQDASDRGYRASARNAKQKVRALRVEFMRPVVQLGRALFPGEAALRQALAMPTAQDYEGLCAAALAMAERAEEHKARFVAAGFGEDFVDRIRTAVDAVRKDLEERASHFGRRSAATAGAEDEMSRGRDWVRLLDIMLTPQLAKTPDQLARWKTLSRFVRSAPEEEEETPVVPVAAPNVGTPLPTDHPPLAEVGAGLARAA